MGSLPPVRACFSVWDDIFGDRHGRVESKGVELPTDLTCRSCIERALFILRTQGWRWNAMLVLESMVGGWGDLLGNSR